MLHFLVRLFLGNGRNGLVIAINPLRSSKMLHHPPPWLSISLVEFQRRTFSKSVPPTTFNSQDVDCTVSQMASVDFAEHKEPEEDFGKLPSNFASRRYFRKSSPGLLDTQYEDEEDEELDRSRAYRKRNTSYWYFLQCKKRIKENKLQEALDMFATDMLKGERLQPEECNYTVLIGGCGRAGQLKKAFKLYNDMKKRGLVPSDATYTALFNACAESASKGHGLQQALKLEQELLQKSYPLSTKTYHALLKTQALNNNLQACIKTLKGMLQKGHPLTQMTCHYLLMACLRDKEAGFLQALQIWQHMLRSGIQPDSKNYNLLLRSARDCGIGDPAQASELLLRSDLPIKKKSGASRGSTATDIDILRQQLFIQAGQDGMSSNTNALVTLETEDQACSTQGSTHLASVKDSPDTLVVPCSSLLEPGAVTPNLLDIFEGGRGAVVSLGSLQSASDRLALIGGAKGFLGKMAAVGLCPDLKTLTLLADTMEPSYQSLQSLLVVAKQHKVKLDVAFFNSVIRRAARNGDLDNAKAVLSVMKERHVRADVQTYGSLALGCVRQKDGLQLISDMEEAGVRPNVWVFGALISQAVQRLDYIYLTAILTSMARVEVWPNEVIIRQLEFAAQYPPNYDKYKSRNNYLVQIDGFRGYYQQWLKLMPVHDPLMEEVNMQPETNRHEEKNGPVNDGVTQVERNMRAAARRYNVKHKGKKQGRIANPV